MSEYYVYILYSMKNGRNYTGMTSDILARMRSHNYLGRESTRYHRPWVLLHYEIFESKSEALKREGYLKCGRGVYEKRAIIERCLRDYGIK